MKNYNLLLVIAAFSLFSIVSLCDAQHQHAPRKKVITRVFWQDAQTNQLRYANLSTTNQWHISTGQVAGTKLPMQPSDTLGDMIQNGKKIMVVNRGATDAIAMIDSGVIQQPHGNHFHWTYAGLPNANSLLPCKQPSFVTMKDNVAYFAHSEGGFSKVRFDAPSLATYGGGGAGLSLAVGANGIAYATHRGDSGKVDVVNTNNPGAAASGSFQIPGGNLIGAAGNSGKAFFSTGEKVHWLIADGNTSPKIMPISNAIGLKHDGSMISDKNWVLFSSNADAEKSLCMINASASTPSVLKLPIKLASGLELSAPKTRLSMGKRLAFVFQRRSEESSEAAELLTIIELDPNRDQNFDDAVVRANIPVGASKPNGERGKHDVCFDDYGRFAVFTSPDDGMLTIMTLNDFQVRARFKVDGTPDRIVAVGSPEHFH